MPCRGPPGRYWETGSPAKKRSGSQKRHPWITWVWKLESTTTTYGYRRSISARCTHATWLEMNVLYHAMRRAGSIPAHPRLPIGTVNASGTRYTIPGMDRARMNAGVNQVRTWSVGGRQTNPKPTLNQVNQVNHQESRNRTSLPRIGKRSPLDSRFSCISIDHTSRARTLRT